MELDSVEAVKALAEAGLGAAAVPRVALREELGSGRLAPVLLPDETPLYREVSRVLRRNEEARIYHWYKKTGTFPPPRPRPGPRPRAATSRK